MSRLVVGAYEATAEGENLLGTTCSEPFTVVRNNDNTEGASYSPIQIPVMPSWVGWDLGCVQVKTPTLQCRQLFQYRGSTKQQCCQCSLDWRLEPFSDAIAGFWEPSRMGCRPPTLCHAGV